MATCSSCGRTIPEGQGNSCSMCYGDMDYGRDGFYREEMEAMERQEQEQERQYNEQMEWEQSQSNEAEQEAEQN